MQTVGVKGSQLVERESGLVVPKDVSEAVPEPRPSKEPALEREAWSNDEYRLLRRVARMLDARGVKFALLCPKPGCGSLISGRDEVSGTVTLTCGCKRREFSVR